MDQTATLCIRHASAVLSVLLIKSLPFKCRLISKFLDFETWLRSRKDHGLGVTGMANHIKLVLLLFLVTRLQGTECRGSKCLMICRILFRPFCLWSVVALSTQSYEQDFLKCGGTGRYHTSYKDTNYNKQWGPAMARLECICCRYMTIHVPNIFMERLMHICLATAIHQTTVRHQVLIHVFDYMSCSTGISQCLRNSWTPVC